MTTKKSKVLIAEDDLLLNKVLTSTLKEEGLKIERVTDGDKALSKIKNNNYDLVILDLIMPGMNGVEILTEIKKLKIKTPVIVFSNLSEDEDINECMNLGAKAYFVKSHMSINEVIKIVKKYLV